MSGAPRQKHRRAGCFEAEGRGRADGFGSQMAGGLGFCFGPRRLVAFALARGSIQEPHVSPRGIVEEFTRFGQAFGGAEFAPGESGSGQLWAEPVGGKGDRVSVPDGGSGRIMNQEAASAWINFGEPRSLSRFSLVSEARHQEHIRIE